MLLSVVANAWEVANLIICLVSCACAARILLLLAEQRPWREGHVRLRSFLVMSIAAVDLLFGLLTTAANVAILMDPDDSAKITFCQFLGSHSTRFCACCSSPYLPPVSYTRTVPPGTPRCAGCHDLSQVLYYPRTIKLTCWCARVVCQALPLTGRPSSST